MHKHPRGFFKRFCKFAVVSLTTLVLLMMFSISPHDESAFRSFSESVQRWQTNPEFRGIAFEYCVRGSDAAASRLCWVPVRKIIIGIRSMPGLPKKYAVTGTSRLHYENFSRGPLSAYLYLCSEQDLRGSIDLMEAEAARNDFSDAEMARYLGSFDMGFPVSQDRGACRSLAATFAAIDASKPFAIRRNIAPLLLKPISAIAGELQIPADPQSMTFDQQHAVFERLDGYIRSHDPQLWRTKQVNDSAAGVWAQAYGPPYTMLVDPILVAHDISKVLLIVLMFAFALRYRQKLRRAISAPATEPEIVQGLLAQ